MARGRDQGPAASPSIGADWGRGVTGCREGPQEVGPSSKLTNSQFYEESGSLLPSFWVQGASEPDLGPSGPPTARSGLVQVIATS